MESQQMLTRRNDAVSARVWNERTHILNAFRSWIRSVGLSCLLRACCGCKDCAWLLLSFPIQTDGVIHAEASVKLDTIFVVIESKWRHHTSFVHQQNPKQGFTLSKSASGCVTCLIARTNNSNIAAISRMKEQLLLPSLAAHTLYFHSNIKVRISRAWSIPMCNARQRLNHKVSNVNFRRHTANHCAQNISYWREYPTKFIQKW